MDDLKQNVEKLAAEKGKTELEIITAMQVGTMVTGNDELLEELCELKWDYIEWDYIE